MTRYSIWVLEYGRVAAFPRSAASYGAHNQGTKNLPFGYVLLKGEGVVALIDAGHDHVGWAGAFAESIGLSNWHGPAEVLGECGLAPEAVTHVILTHAHFDHMGGIGSFPNATIYVQERELTGWVATMALGRRFRSLMGGVDPGDVLRLVEFAQRGRLVTVAGVRDDVLPGVDLRPAFDTHTPGSQYVVVRNDAGSREASWVIAGDLVYGYDNLDGGDPEDPQFVPVGLATGSQTNLAIASEEMLRTVSGDPQRVLPVHEERLTRVFPSRRTAAGLWLTEVALRGDEPTRVA